MLFYVIFNVMLHVYLLEQTLNGINQRVVVRKDSRGVHADNVRI